MEKSETIWNRRFILLFITNLLVLAAFYTLGAWRNRQAPQ